MKNFQLRFVLSALCFASMLLTFNAAFAAPVRLGDVVQTVNAKPGQASNGDFSQLLLVNEYALFKTEGGDDTDDTAAVVADDDRVITMTKTEIVEEGPCDCEIEVVKERKFQYWWLGLAAIPLIFLWGDDDKKKRTPTPHETPETPTPTPHTPTPKTHTPTPTPKTHTPTPPNTPKTPTPPPHTPTPPEPVPEPMTLLLFGSGLAGIGIAARKKFGKKKDTESSN